jgi:hypothetical protein
MWIGDAQPTAASAASGTIAFAMRGVFMLDSIGNDVGLRSGRRTVSASFTSRHHLNRGPHRCAAEDSTSSRGNFRDARRA